MTDDYAAANRRYWDEVVPVHERSAFYDVPAFIAGRSTLKPLELAEVGEVRGQSLLHLQCHFGLDTLSWAREGAVVTGIDLSAPAIATARRLAAETGLAARFVESDVYALPERLDGGFDIVFTSYGVLGWLPDLRRWAQVAAGFVRPGGRFYIAEFHPMAWAFDDAPGMTDLHLRYSYFRTPEPIAFTGEGTYADPAAPIASRTTYSWPFTLGDVVTALVEAGLRLEFLHEYPYSYYQFLPFTEAHADGRVRLRRHDGCVPLMFSIGATRPA